MMTKITKRQDFGRLLRYVIDPKKDTRILAVEGIRGRKVEYTARSFEAQASMNPRVSKPVGHISLNFSAQNKDKLTDAVMTRIARDYMERMGIRDTQFVIARHNDKDHPHLHIIFNRVDNNGRTITDSNDRLRSEKICKELTRKYGLYLSGGKENVNEHRLREPDKTKYEIFHALEQAVSKCRNWDELRRELARQGIGLEFKYNGDTSQVQGVKFTKGQYHFNGSKVDRRFSYSKIDWLLRQNERAQKQSIPTQSIAPSRPDSVVNTVASVFEAAGSIAGGLFDIHPSGTDYDPNEAEFRRQEALKKKKKKKGRSM